MARRTERLDTLRLRLTRAEKRTLEAAASASGTSVNEYVLSIALGDARRFVAVTTGLEELARALSSRGRRKTRCKPPNRRGKSKIE